MKYNTGDKVVILTIDKMLQDPEVREGEDMLGKASYRTSWTFAKEVILARAGSREVYIDFVTYKNYLVTTKNQKSLIIEDWMIEGPAEQLSVTAPKRKPFTIDDIHIGDRVKIRTWEDMKEEFGLRDGHIQPRRSDSFPREMERDISKLPERIVTVDRIEENSFHSKDTHWLFDLYMVGEILPPLEETSPASSAETGEVPVDRLTELENRINDYEEGYRQCDRCTTELADRVKNVESHLQKLASLQEKVIALERSIARMSDIRW